MTGFPSCASPVLVCTIPVPDAKTTDQSLPSEAYYVVMRMPGESKAEFLLLQPMIAEDAGQAGLPPELSATAKKLRGQFAALAPQRRWLKAQPDGSELDVDACVRNHADRASGHTPSTNARKPGSAVEAASMRA